MSSKSEHFIPYFFGLNFAFYVVVTENILWNGKQRTALFACAILSELFYKT